jgi:predicted nucleotidyltransferase
MSLAVQLGDAHVDAAELADLCQRFGVTELAPFGSAVRGQMRPDSDIDVMVEFDTARGLKPWVRPEVLRAARVVYAA